MQQPNMADRQPFTTSTIINNPTINILNLPSTAATQLPPAAFQPHPSFAKLNPAAPTFTPGTISKQDAAAASNNALPSTTTQIEQSQQCIQASMAKLQLLTAQLNSLNATISNGDPSQVQNYQNLYAAYQMELTNVWLLQQYLANLQKDLVNSSASSCTPASAASTAPVLETIGGLESIEEGEEEETWAPTPCAVDVHDEGDDIERKCDESDASSVVGEHAIAAAAATTVETARNLWKFPVAAAAAETLQIVGEKNSVGVNKKTAESEKIKKQIRGILNKITPENFDKLSQDISSILKLADITVGHETFGPSFADLNEEELRVAQKAQFKALIRLILKCILEKAVGEPLFSTQYARLCYSLYLYAEHSEMKKKVFRMQLIALCHSVFKKSREQADSSRFLGIVTMIGELFHYGLISWNVIHSGVFEELLPPETALDVEGVCKLLKLQGHKFDKHYWKEIEAVIAALNEYAPQYEFRIQCLVREITEMRHNSWQQRKDLAQETPKMLHEIRDASSSRPTTTRTYQVSPPANHGQNYYAASRGYAMHGNNERWRGGNNGDKYSGYPQRQQQQQQQQQQQFDAMMRPALNVELLASNELALLHIEEQNLDCQLKLECLKSYLMTRCQFGRLLRTKCEAFLQSRMSSSSSSSSSAAQPRGMLLCSAIRVLLSFPLSDKYALLTPPMYDAQHPLNKYHNKRYVDNYDQNALQDVDTLGVWNAADTNSFLSLPPFHLHHPHAHPHPHSRPHHHHHLHHANNGTRTRTQQKQKASLRNNNNNHAHMQNCMSRQQMKEQLSLLGFTARFVQRAFKAYEHHFGRDTYLIEKMQAVIVMLRRTGKNKNGAQTKHSQQLNCNHKQQSQYPETDKNRQTLSSDYKRETYHGPDWQREFQRVLKKNYGVKYDDVNVGGLQ